MNFGCDPEHYWIVDHRFVIAHGVYGCVGGVMLCSGDYIVTKFETLIIDNLD